MATKKKPPFEKAVQRDERFELIDQNRDTMGSFSTLEEAREMIQEIAHIKPYLDKDVIYYLVEKKLVGTFTIPKVIEPKVVYNVVK